MAEKNLIAKRDGLEMYIETQFCFEECSFELGKESSRAGNELPIRIGIPGQLQSKRCSNLLKFLNWAFDAICIKRARNVTKLMTVQSPHLLLSGLARGMVQDPECLIKHFHFYPFGGFTKTAEYAQAIESGQISLLSAGGFELMDR